MYKETPTFILLDLPIPEMDNESLSTALKVNVRETDISCKVAMRLYLHKVPKILAEASSLNFIACLLGVMGAVYFTIAGFFTNHTSNRSSFKLYGNRSRRRSLYCCCKRSSSWNWTTYSWRSYWLVCCSSNILCSFSARSIASGLFF